MLERRRVADADTRTASIRSPKPGDADNPETGCAPTTRKV